MWAPELFTAPTLARLQRQWELDEQDAIPYYAGLMAGEHEALIGSFADQPILHDPRRGRVIGVRAFEAYVAELSAWLAERNMSYDPVEHAVAGRRGFEEVVLHLDGAGTRVDAPVAIIAERNDAGRLTELRLYHSIWALTGQPLHRPPLLQRDPDLHVDGVVAEYQRAQAVGDVEAIVATFAPDGYAREPAGEPYVHRGHDAVRAFYAQRFADGGVAVEQCAIVHDGDACALEYNIVGWGATQLPPEAGVAVFVRGASGRLDVVRMYDDAAAPDAAR
jgi:hypothetical protein